ncbi:hypothetical protein [Herbiconiux sp. L3-i23]|uniref:hypothetical protein n=1 Tax=Herbiconiux sp. L3-i23 TaxID=2905871 RepID=UPI0020567354|nr:hypothetical protein [Herbiconiux sp. L3-i23]BDI24130.1 hypothetical protein L3i23_29060 [Herbiconiux sp. L3-i23]
MRTSRLSLVPLALAATLLAGCTGQNAQPVGAQTPEPIDDDALLVALEDIAPGLGGEGSIEAADAICAAIDDGDDSEAVDELALEELGGVADEELTEEQVQSAVRYIATEYCA